MKRGKKWEEWGRENGIAISHPATMECLKDTTRSVHDCWQLAVCVWVAPGISTQSTHMVSEDDRHSSAILVRHVSCIVGH